MYSGEPLGARIELIGPLSTVILANYDFLKILTCEGEGKQRTDKVIPIPAYTSSTLKQLSDKGRGSLLH